MPRRSLLKQLCLLSRSLRLPLPHHSLLHGPYTRRRNRRLLGRRKALLAVPRVLRREDLRARRTRRALMAARRIRRARMAVPRVLRRAHVRQAASTVRQEDRPGQAERGPQKAPN